MIFLKKCQSQEGACPNGWHIPDVAEMTELNTWLNNASNRSSFNPQYAGGAIADHSYTGYGTDMYLFYVNNNGTDLNSLHNTIKTTAGAAYLYLQSNGSHNLAGQYYSAGSAFSIRCVQDITY